MATSSPTAERTRTATCSYCQRVFEFESRPGPTPTCCTRTACQQAAATLRRTRERKANQDKRDRDRRRIADLEEENRRLRALAGVGDGAVAEPTEQQVWTDGIRGKLDVIAQDGPATQVVDFVVATALRAGALPDSGKMDLKREVVRLAGARGAVDTSAQLVELCARGISWGSRLRTGEAADGAGRLAA